MSLNLFFSPNQNPKTIATVLEKLLYKEVSHDIRIQAYELLMIFLDELDQPEKAKLQLWASCIDLTVLAGGIKVNLPFTLPSGTRKKANSKKKKKTYFDKSFFSLKLPNSLRFWCPQINHNKSQKKQKHF